MKTLCKILMILVLVLAFEQPAFAESGLPVQVDSAGSGSLVASFALANGAAALVKEQRSGDQASYTLVYFGAEGEYIEEAWPFGYVSPPSILAVQVCGKYAQLFAGWTGGEIQRVRWELPMPSGLCETKSYYLPLVR